MAVLDNGAQLRHSPSPKKPPQPSDAKIFGLCPFWQSGNAQTTPKSQSNRRLMETPKTTPKAMSFVARSLLPPRRRLRLDPSKCLHFPCTSSFSYFLLFSFTKALNFHDCLCFVFFYHFKRFDFFVDFSLKEHISFCRLVL